MDKLCIVLADSKHAVTVAVVVVIMLSRMKFLFLQVKNNQIF